MERILQQHVGLRYVKSFKESLRDSCTCEFSSYICKTQKVNPSDALGILVSMQSNNAARFKAPPISASEQLAEPFRMVMFRTSTLAQVGRLTNSSEILTSTAVFCRGESYKRQTKATAMMQTKKPALRPGKSTDQTD